jgi:hypothetical protein
MLKFILLNLKNALQLQVNGIVLKPQHLNFQNTDLNN